MVGPYTRLDKKSYRVLIAKSQVALSVALGDFDSIVDIINVHGVVSDVLHDARTTAAL